MRTLVILATFLIAVGASHQAHAQYQRTNFWGVSYSFMQVKTNEGQAVEVGHIPVLGVELGIAFSQGFAMTFNGVYGADSMNFSGTNLIGVQTNQLLPVHILEARVDALFMGQSFFFNLGYGYRDFYDDISGTYARDIRTTFLPVGISYYFAPFYVKGEYRRYISGEEEVESMGGGRNDVTLSQGGGNCYALEAGWILGRAPMGLKLSLQYALWNIDNSDSANDGVETIHEPGMQTAETTLGFQMIF